jgi:hypothetical protein
MVDMSLLITERQAEMGSRNALTCLLAKVEDLAADGIPQRLIGGPQSHP